MDRYSCVNVALQQIKLLLVILRSIGNIFGEFSGLKFLNLYMIYIKVFSQYRDPAYMSFRHSVSAGNRQHSG